MTFPNYNTGSIDPMEQQRLQLAQSLGINPQSLNYGSNSNSYGAPAYQTMDTSIQGLFGPETTTPLAWNLPTAQLGLGAVNSLGNLWGSMKANKLANQQFNFTKQAYETNLANSIKAYNTNLEGREGARLRAAGKSQAEIDAYLNKNKLG